MGRRAMRRLLVAGAAVGVGALGAGGCVRGGGGGGSAARSGAPQTTAEQSVVHARLIATGRRVYAGHCAICHRLLGRIRVAGRRPDAFGPSFDEVVEPASYVVERITNGFGGMQGFSGELTAGQIRAVAAYVVSVEGRDVRAQPRTDAAQLAAGRAVFAARCARCHALLGQPASAPTRWPPTDFDVVRPSARFVASLLDRSGNPFLRSFMARLQGRLTRREIRDVAAYVSAVAGDGNRDGGRGGGDGRP